MPTRIDDIEWMISVVKCAMDHGTLNYTNDEYDRMVRIYKEVYGEDAKS